MTNFKNYEQQSLSLCPGINCFVGLNGMGKTNILDAIYYLCMGKSHFGVPDSGVKRKGTDFFRLQGQFSLDGKMEKIVTKVQPPKRKEVERNGKVYERLMDHIGLLPVVMIVPDDTELVTGGSEVRRRLLDNTLAQLDANYLRALLKYNKVLQLRNAALKKMAADKAFDYTLLETYNHQLLPPAKLIFQSRRDFLLSFTTAFSHYYQLISGDRESVAITYRSQLLEKSLGDCLLQSAEKDRILQRTTCGIHKDELVLSLDGQALKRFASQGQIKSFTLALKLAQYNALKQKKNTQPILLLDDIFDKLDRSRVGQLIQLLVEEDFGQICITDTHENRLADIMTQLQTDYLKYTVENGRVLEEPV